jgi:hypothetical protein
MRLVSGGDVRAIVRQHGSLPAARTAAIVSPIASALDTAHAAGLVHRDVKPCRGAAWLAGAEPFGVTSGAARGQAGPDQFGARCDA